MKDRPALRRKWSPVFTRAAAVRSIIGYVETFNRLDTMVPKVRGTMLQTITRSSAWYAVCRDGIWYVAPSKFGGCDAMTPELYDVCRNGEGGIEVFSTTAALDRFADGPPILENHPAHKALTAWAARFDRSPKMGFTVKTITDVPTSERLAGEVSPRSDPAVLELPRFAMTIDENAFIAFATIGIRGLSPEGKERLIDILVKA